VARFSAHAETGLEAHPASCTIDTESFLVENGLDVALTTHPHLTPRLNEYTVNISRAAELR
jgi:hypothetical protein